MEQRIYRIVTLPLGTAPTDVDWNDIPSAPIDHFFWLTGHTPATHAQLVYLDGFGFVLRMTCEETAPKALYRQYNDPVYTDSCMEFFCDWLGDGRYINMEMNPLGTLLAGIGPGRHGRRPITEFSDGEIFVVKGEINPTSWNVIAYIPTELLCRILGVKSIPFGKGYSFRGNFYKCGDNTAIPHYGMWSPVGTETPDFHRPEYFGTLVMD